MSLPDPASPLAPKFWRYETGVQLGPVIERYLNRRKLSAEDVNLIRAYLRQWIDSPVWDMAPAGDLSRELASLRATTSAIQSRADIDRWIWAGLEIGIDPL
jgi:hypothetical protein